MFGQCAIRHSRSECMAAAVVVINACVKLFKYHKMVKCARILLVASTFRTFSISLFYSCHHRSKRECQEYEETGKLWSKEVCYVCVYVVHLTCLLVNKHLCLIGLLVCLYSTAHLYNETGCTASNSWWILFSLFSLWTSMLYWQKDDWEFTPCAYCPKSLIHVCWMLAKCSFYFVYVADPSRNRTLFHCVFRLHYRFQSAVAQNFC